MNLFFSCRIVWTWKRSFRSHLSSLFRELKFLWNGLTPKCTQASSNKKLHPRLHHGATKGKFQIHHKNISTWSHSLSGFVSIFSSGKKTSQNCGKKIEKQHKKYSESIEFQITSIHCTVQSTFRYAHLKKQHFDVYSEGGKKRETIFRSATKTSVWSLHKKSVCMFCVLTKITTFAARNESFDIDTGHWGIFSREAILIVFCFTSTC